LVADEGVGEDEVLSHDRHYGDLGFRRKALSGDVEAAQKSGGRLLCSLHLIACPRHESGLRTEIKTLRRYRKPIASPECRNEHDAALVALVASGGARHYRGSDRTRPHFAAVHESGSGPNPTWSDVRFESAFEGKAEVGYRGGHVR